MTSQKIKTTCANSNDWRWPAQVLSFSTWGKTIRCQVDVAQMANLFSKWSLSNCTVTKCQSQSPNETSQMNCHHISEINVEAAHPVKESKGGVPGAGRSKLGNVCLAVGGGSRFKKSARFCKWNVVSWKDCTKSLWPWSKLVASFGQQIVPMHASVPEKLELGFWETVGKDGSATQLATLVRDLALELVQDTPHSIVQVSSHAVCCGNLPHRGKPYTLRWCCEILEELPEWKKLLQRFQPET